MHAPYRMIDIGANLCDAMFQGIYHGRKHHPCDLEQVLRRAKQSSVEKVIVTAGDYSNTIQALSIIKQFETYPEFKNMLSTTCGVHPTQCNVFDNPSHIQLDKQESTGLKSLETPSSKSVSAADQYMNQLLALVNENRQHVVAIGEFGLDYDRLYFCDQSMQLHYFERQFWLAEKTGLPLFLHSRAAANDFATILRRNRSRFIRGVVHSFTGSLEEMQELIKMDLYVGINGCSLKTTQNLQVAKSIPLDRLLIETDAPWCEIRPIHAGYAHIKSRWNSVKKEKWSPDSCVRGRCEPCHLINVLEILAQVRGVDPEQLATQIYKNALDLFFPMDRA